jgi:hypothetical protein
LQRKVTTKITGNETDIHHLALSACIICKRMADYLQFFASDYEEKRKFRLLKLQLGIFATNRLG